MIAVKFNNPVKFCFSLHICTVLMQAVPIVKFGLICMTKIWEDRNKGES